MTNEALTVFLTLLGQDAPLSEDEKSLLEFSRDVVLAEGFGYSQQALDEQRRAVEFHARLVCELEALMPSPSTFLPTGKELSTGEQLLRRR